jgi:poly(A) polymerase
VSQGTSILFLIQTGGFVKKIIAADLNRQIDSASPVTIKQLIDALYAQGMNVYVAGGAPRDWLLGSNARDIDLTIDGTVTEAYGICNQLFTSDMLILHENFGLVVANGDCAQVDINIMRDVDDMHRSVEHCVFIPTNQINRDFLSRDFSINCFYYNCHTHTIENPTEHGAEDLKNRRLRLIMAQKKIDLDQRVCIRILQFLARDYKATTFTQQVLDQRLETDILTFSEFEPIFRALIRNPQEYKTL